MADSDSSNDHYESKQLELEIKENEAKYVSGELSLEEPLKKTEKLYESAFAAAEKTTANRVLQDSSLMQLQSKIVRQCAKSYKPNTLVFNATSLSEKLKRFYTGLFAEKDKKSSNKVYSEVWLQLGIESRKHMHVTPSLNYINGTFSPDPATPIKKKRKRVEKDKIADATKPTTISLNDNSEGKDKMLSQATRIFSILVKLVHKMKKSSICYYEFVIDPNSFTRTIEHIFIVSLLVQNGHVCIFPDEQGLPCIRIVEDGEKRERQLVSGGRMQSVISMSVVEWEALIRKFNFKQCLIPPPRSQKSNNQN